MKAAWAHFTSWWVYPASMAVTTAMIILMLLDIKFEVAYLVLRTDAVATGLAYAYDHGWRRTRPRRRKKKTSRFGG